jgi:hypothetical protein
MRPFMTLSLLSFCCLSVSLSGGTIVSEDFDELTPQLSVTSAGAFSAINGTNVDIVGGLNGSLLPALCAAPESGNCLDMGGTGGNDQGQLQSNMLFPAGSYLLSFDLIGSQRSPTVASTTVTFGNYSQEFTLGVFDDTDGIVVNQPVTLSAPGYLLFVSDTPGDVGDLLDDVVVSTVPEPSGLLLIAPVLLLPLFRMVRRLSSGRRAGR